MTNEEKWANTLKALHEAEPAPFNPNYNEEQASKLKTKDRFMFRLRQELNKIETKDNAEILDKIDDMVYLYISAVQEFHGYSMVNGKITHNSARGKQLIKETFGE